jgi:transcription initiation factor IIE alpha subunit
MKLCTICGKGIEEPKFRIHEATCARNNYKCPKCGEVLSKSEKDHHESEMHTMVSNLLMTKLLTTISHNSKRYLHHNALILSYCLK